MLIRRATKLFVLIALALAGCGDKVPESQTAVKIGQQPKQIIDKASADVNKALQTGTAARQDAEKKE